MRVHNGQREVLVPTKRVGTSPAAANTPVASAVPRDVQQVAPLEEHPSNPWDVVAVPSSPEVRRQLIQIALGAITAIFVLLGFVASVFWGFAVICLLLLLSYLALAHEVNKRSAERDRARKLAKVRGDYPTQATKSRPRRAASSASRERASASTAAAQAGSRPRQPVAR